MQMLLPRIHMQAMETMAMEMQEITTTEIMEDIRHPSLLNLLQQVTILPQLLTMVVVEATRAEVVAEATLGVEMEVVAVVEILEAAETEL